MNRILHYIHFAVLVWTVSLMTSCKIASVNSSTGTSTFLSVESTGEVPLPGVTSTDTAAQAVTTSERRSTSSQGATGLQLSGQDNQDTKVAGRSKWNRMFVAFGYGKSDAAQLIANIVPCKSMPDPVVSAMDWATRRNVSEANRYVGDRTTWSAIVRSNSRCFVVLCQSHRIRRASRRDFFQTR